MLSTAHMTLFNVIINKESAVVYREFSIDDNRRIDIVIRTKERLVPIEVKIYAGEQQNQCYDYYQKAINSHLFYLTRFGDFPSDYSANTLTDKQVTAISFSDDILNWLEKCLEQKETIKIAESRMGTGFQGFLRSICER